MSKSSQIACLISGFLLFFCGFICQPAWAQEETIEVSAAILIDDYVANELAADQKYKGKIFLVTGKIDTIAKDMFGKPYITISGDDMFRRVQIEFPDDMIDKLAQLKKGTNVRVKGKCEGLMMHVQMKFVRD